MNILTWTLLKKTQMLNGCETFAFKYKLHSGSYMSAHVVLNLLNKLRKRDKKRGYLLFATSFMTSMIQEQEC